MDPFDRLGHAAVALVEAQDAGQDTSGARAYYDYCRVEWLAEKDELDQMLDDMFD